jgi:hypothetical protein
VNLKKQNQLKKLLEEMSRQRARDQPYLGADRKPALPDEQAEDEGLQDENEEASLQVQSKQIAQGNKTLNGFTR